MRTNWIRVLVGFIAAVLLTSVVIALVSPDGEVGDEARPKPSASASATPAPTPTREPVETSADRAPAAVRGNWPGRPNATRLRGSRVDWCPAVRTTGAAEAVRVFGKAAVRSAACRAVRFVFEQRYSRLAVPRRSYAAEDFDVVLSKLAPTTVSLYRPRIHSFLSCPDRLDLRRALGLVLFRGEGTAADAEHTAAGHGRVFYGPAFSTKGYRGRAVWVNPTWSKVAISVDRSKASPRIVATLEAAASLPVFNVERRRHDMLTVSTDVTFFLRNDGTSWKIGGWTEIPNGTREYGRLEIT